MAAASAETGQLITIVVMAIALGMDAFSLGIGIGLRGIRLLDILKISFVIGLFHILMPLIGMFMGHYVGTLLGNVATITGGALLVLLGAHMIFSSLKGPEMRPFDHRTLWGLLFFALSVSVDSMSVGVSLGMFSTDLAFTVLMFGGAGGLMSVGGLLLGRRAGSWVGEYGEAVGGVILLAFGIRFLI
ncbi:manganese efflux pump MntP [Paenibacillus sp. GYB003]|uniref:manganese efflux pump MntP n=1 Tax=Paenibacillus sp. GYB003 TaxID=2994392 RepID=UPI002F96AD75